MSKVKRKSAQEIVAESGNAFHCKVATAFRTAGWSVTISPYYVDSATDKPREFDLLCEKKITWRDTWQQQHSLWYQLFVECKYIKQPMVFWFDVRDQERSKHWLDSTTPFKSDNINHVKQHYMQAGGHVAKLFANGVQEEQEPIYKALAQCLGGMTQGNWDTDVPSTRAQVNAAAQTTTPALIRPSSPTLTVLRYPVIVHSDSSPLYRVEVVGGDGPPVPLTTNFVLEVNYAYVDRRGRNQQEYFLIDVVGISRLTDFFATLEQEVEGAQFFISTH